jgi:hypothetical protein
MANLQLPRTTQRTGRLRAYLNRRKSAYPTLQSPIYDRATRDLTLELLNDSGAPILPLINTRVVREMAERRMTGKGGYLGKKTRSFVTG